MELLQTLTFIEGEGRKGVTVGCGGGGGEVKKW